MKQIKLFSVGLICALLGPSLAWSDDDSGVYVGFSANRLSVDNVETSDTDFEDSDTAFGAKAGIMLTDLFGIEGGYLDLGDYETRGQEEGRNLSLDAEGWYLAGVVNLALSEELDLYGKLGVFSVDSDSDFTDFEESSTEVFGGVGVEYDLGSLNFFGEFNVIDTDVADINWDVISVGVKFELGGY